MTEQNGNGNGKIAWGTIVMIAAVVGGIAAIFRPLQQAQDTLQRQVDRASKWQEDYMRGLIPSSAERELASQKMQFVEVETQFRGQKETIQRLGIEIDRLIEHVETMREQLAVLRNDEHRTMPGLR